MPQGTIKTFDVTHGYGFIIPEGRKPREDDKFFHITECQEGYEPAPGDLVSFKEGRGRGDRPCAVQVAPA